MSLFLDAFWRAAAYCLHPRVILLSLAPLVLMVALALGLGWLYWDVAVAGMRALLESWSLLSVLWAWLAAFGVGDVNSVLAPLIVLFAALPVLVIVCLIAVAVLMAPALVGLVAQRRFATLERLRGGSVFTGLLWSLGSTLLAVVALVLSLPLWLIPPLVLVLPPLIWGWLTYRVMAYDVLAEHASAAERREIFRRHRGWLLAIGVITGYMGAAPSLLWASGVVFAAAFVVLVPLAVWIYTLVLAFAALWFAHYGLAALEQLRAQAAAVPPAAPPPAQPLALEDVQPLPLPPI
ncbi:MAG: EI24 domain-containing protein [Ramlibacter sp.]|jgi:hypothetical protein|nr:EI24 domain-containing protein [Ramlibacter sp.]